MAALISFLSMMAEEVEKKRMETEDSDYISTEEENMERIRQLKVRHVSHSVAF